MSKVLFLFSALAVTDASTTYKPVIPHVWTGSAKGFCSRYNKLWFTYPYPRTDEETVPGDKYNRYHPTNGKFTQEEVDDWNSGTCLLAEAEFWRCKPFGSKCCAGDDFFGKSGFPEFPNSIKTSHFLDGQSIKLRNGGLCVTGPSGLDATKKYKFTFTPGCTVGPFHSVDPDRTNNIEYCMGPHWSVPHQWSTDMTASTDLVSNGVCIHLRAGAPGGACSISDRKSSKDESYAVVSCPSSKDFEHGFEFGCEEAYDGTWPEGCDENVLEGCERNWTQTHPLTGKNTYAETLIDGSVCVKYSRPDGCKEIPTNTPCPCTRPLGDPKQLYNITLEECTTSSCPTPTATDGVQNGDETDQDCGGGTAGSTGAPKCDDNKACTDAARDCTSGVCTSNTCTAPATDVPSPSPTLRPTESMPGHGTECNPTARFTTGIDCSKDPVYMAQFSGASTEKLTVVASILSTVALVASCMSLF